LILTNLFKTQPVIQSKQIAMNTFTLTRYQQIDEKPLVILIDTKHTNDKTCSNLEDLYKQICQQGEKIYFVADSKDNRLHGLDNWNDHLFTHKSVINKISNYLNSKNEKYNG